FHTVSKHVQLNANLDAAHVRMNTLEINALSRFFYLATRNLIAGVRQFKTADNSIVLEPEHLGRRGIAVLLHFIGHGGVKLFSRPEARDSHGYSNSYSAKYRHDILLF